ncbi:MAG: DUF4922 domain-containing protein [Muribaculaceae bacterium]|nr:DUF4922 domain-containing protein [Muribaculaceae bacterium]
MLTQDDVTRFLRQQLEEWPEAKARFDALDSVLTRRIDIDGFPITVTFNPARIRSSAAKTDKASIAARPCFLCDANRPEVQRYLDWREYRILVNPFPILPQHFTIVAREHRPQSIEGTIADMTALSLILPAFAIFYNGPACGASAPDHFHFQAVRRDALPMFGNEKLPMGVVRLRGDKANQETVDAVMSRLPHDDGEQEAKVNIFCSTENGVPEITIIPRRRHRPDFYGEEGMLVSPASIDLAGVMVAPRREDFDKFSPEIIRSIYSQLCFTQAELNNMLNDIIKQQ